jgi:hypothetical protein
MRWSSQITSTPAFKPDCQCGHNSTVVSSEQFHDNVVGTRDVLQPTTLLRYFNTYSSFFHMLSKSPRIPSPAHAHALPDDEQLGVSRFASPFAISRLLATHHIICPMLCPLSSLFPSATMATGANPSLALRSSPLTFMDTVPNLRCSVDLLYPWRICCHRVISEINPFSSPVPSISLSYPIHSYLLSFQGGHF